MSDGFDLQCTLRRATYAATATEWRRVADRLDEIGERRLAAAVRFGLERQSRAWRYYGSDVHHDVVVRLRFTQGSVAKFDALAGEEGT